MPTFQARTRTWLPGAMLIATLTLRSPSPSPSASVRTEALVPASASAPSGRWRSLRWMTMVGV